MTWIKRLLFLAIIFFGLYYFGDFRVNEVNVRDYLQQKVTKDNMEQAKKFVLQVYEAAKSFYDSLHKKDDAKPADTTQSAKSAMSLDNVTNALQNISDDDRRKLMDLIKTDATKAQTER